MPNILQATTIYIVNILTRSPSPLWHHPTTLNGTPWRTILSDHRPCKLKVLPRKSSRFHNPQSNVLQFLPYSSPASALDASYGRMALCFHEDGRTPKWKFWGGWWCLICLFFSSPQVSFHASKRRWFSKEISTQPVSRWPLLVSYMKRYFESVSHSFLGALRPTSLWKFRSHIYHMCWDLQQETSNLSFFCTTLTPWNWQFAPENRPGPIRKLFFQPSIFRRNVSFRDGTPPISVSGLLVVSKSKLDHVHSIFMQ